MTPRVSFPSMRPTALVLAVLLTTTALAGCLAGDDQDLDPNAGVPGPLDPDRLSQAIYDTIVRTRGDQLGG